MNSLLATNVLLYSGNFYKKPVFKKGKKGKLRVGTDAN